MTTLLIIDSDGASRQAVHAAAPPDWTVLEASDGLRGLDAVRQHAAPLDLIAIDPQLPDLEGRLVYVQLRTLCPMVPILPITRAVHMLPLLAELGCLPACLKPVVVDELARRLRAAASGGPAAPPPSALAPLLLEYALAAEQRLCQERCPLRVLVYASSPITRAGLTQLLSPAALVHEAAQPGALRRALNQFRYHALVADANDSEVVLPAGHAAAIPLVLVAGSPAQASLALVEGVVGVVLEQDPAAPVRLTQLLDAIAAGERYAAPPYDVLPSDPDQSLVPAAIVRRFVSSPVTPRELAVLWLDAQGWTSERIARHLTVDRATITSYWKRVQRKLQRDRAGVRAWVRARLADDPPPDPPHEHADGTASPAPGA